MAKYQRQVQTCSATVARFLQGANLKTLFIHLAYLCGTDIISGVTHLLL